MSDETALALTGQTNLRLVAFDPAELQRSQQHLIQWAQQKIIAVTGECDDLRANLDIATKNKWNTVRPKAALKKAESRLLFYTKIRDALQAGYYIVPDFPCDVFAIRTERLFPRRNEKHSHSGNYYNIIPDEKAQILPPGEGEYQNPQQTIDRSHHKYTDGQNKEQIMYTYRATDFMEMDFPFALAKPQILDATQRAMAMKIFDEMAVSPAGSRRSTKPDPMVLGIIKMPKTGYVQKQITFLVAWFIDTETL